MCVLVKKYIRLTRRRAKLVIEGRVLFGSGRQQKRSFEPYSALTCAEDALGGAEFGV